MKRLFLISILSFNLLYAEYVYSPSEPIGNELLIPAPAKVDFQKKDIHNNGAISEINMSNQEDIKLVYPNKNTSERLLNEEIIANNEESGDQDFNKVPLGVKEQVIETEEDLEESGDQDFNKVPLGVKEQIMN